MNSLAIVPEGATITLAAYNDMCAAIDKCMQFDEAKEFQDKAKALEAYFRQANNMEAEQKCALIRFRAAQRCGELLGDMKKSGQREAQGGDRKSKSQNGTLKLADLGISKKQSSEWQQLAQIPWEEIETSISSNLATHVSVGGLLRDIEEYRHAVESQKFTPPPRRCSKCRHLWDGPQLVCPKCGGPEAKIVPSNQTCTKCGHTWQGGPECPACGEWDIDKYTRMVQLFYNGLEKREFDRLEQTLRQRYSTKNASETVMEALRREVAGGAA